MDQADHLHQRPGHPPREHLEGDQRSDRNRVVEHQIGAVPDHADGHHHLEHLAETARRHRNLAHPEVGFDGVGGGIVPDPFLHRFERQRFDRADAVNRLDQHALTPPFRLVQFIQPVLEGLDQRRDHQRHQRREGQHHQRQLNAVAEQKRNEDAERRQIQHCEEEVAREKSPDPLGLLHVLEQHSGGNSFEEVHRQPHQVLKGLGRGRDVDLVGGEEQEVAAHIFDQRVEQNGDQNADAEHVQRVVGAVHQHLVHHDLEEERNDQREDRQQRHHQRNLPEHPLELQKFRNEPAEREGLVLVGERVGLLQQDAFARALLLIFLPVPEAELLARRQVFGGVDDHQFELFAVLAQAAEDEVGAAFFDCNRRHHAGGGEELLPAQLEFAGLEAVIRSDLPEEVFAHLAVADGVFVHDAAQIHLRIVVLGDGGEAVEARLLGVVHHRQIAEDQDFAAELLLEHLLRARFRRVPLGAGGIEHLNLRHLPLQRVGQQEPGVVPTAEKGRAVVTSKDLRRGDLLGAQFLVIGQFEQRFRRILQILLPDALRHNGGKIHAAPELGEEYLQA